MKWIVAALAVIGFGLLAYFSVMFVGPHMRVQQHVLTYQKRMPLPPKGMVPVEPDPYDVPTARKAAGLRNPLPDTRANRDRGKVYYGYYCVFCHGENGQGDGPVGYSYMPAPANLHALRILRMSDGELFRSMLLGIGHEPVLRGVVLPEHRWYLVTYVRALGRTSRKPAQNPAEYVILPRPDRDIKRIHQ